MNGIFDTHAHYFDVRFEKEAEGGADAVLRSVFQTGVETILNVSTNCENARSVIAQAARYPGMYAAVGIHPEDCHFLADESAALSQLRTLLGTAQTRARDKIIALGEIGLDYHYASYGEIASDKDKQQRFFEAQLQLASELSLPVIIHDREAHGACLETVFRYPRLKGVFHSYSGSAEMAKALTSRGWYLSFSGTLTFQNANRVREAARAVPRDRLLVETDCPYLAPHPMRGHLNHSGLLPYTLSVLAQLWNCTPEEAALQTSKNAKKLFFAKDS